MPASALFAVSIESGNARIATSPLRELCKREGPDGVKDLRIVPLLYSVAAEILIALQELPSDTAAFCS